MISSTSFLDAPSNSDRSKEASTTTEPTVDLDYEHVGANGATPIPLLSASTFSTPTKKYRSTADNSDDDYLDQTTFDDVAMMQFDSVQAPFLRSASNFVKSEFQKVWEDQNIPSESLRSLKAREQEMRHLSFDAKQALRILSLQKDDIRHIVVPAEVKHELTTFVQRLNRRRNLKLVH
uniref:Biogenesis of lysosome-related organelles complex 1 subunit 3 n=1 Tax=Caenorhabditis tropicalis TaxID=1561998 RepID=A0A1I7T9R5_9PELO